MGARPASFRHPKNDIRGVFCVLRGSGWRLAGGNVGGANPALGVRGANV